MVSLRPFLELRAPLLQIERLGERWGWQFLAGSLEQFLLSGWHVISPPDAPGDQAPVFDTFTDQELDTLQGLSTRLRDAAREVAGR